MTMIPHDWIEQDGILVCKSCGAYSNIPRDEQAICAGEQRQDPVVQDWVSRLPWKMQSILFSSLRGPDQEFLANIKMVSKWMRSVTQNNADPSKPYMNGISLPEPEQLFKELEHCPCHFVHHFLDGLAIIAYHHPIQIVAEYAAKVHYRCAEEIFHFYPEPPRWFDIRHRDKRKGADPLADHWRNFELSQSDNYYKEALRRFDGDWQLGHTWPP